MTSRIVLALCVLVSIAFAQPPAPVKTIPVPDLAKSAPVISTDLKLKFFKASSETQAASSQAKAAAEMANEKSAAWKAALAEVRAVCGDKFQLDMDKEGYPVCSAKPTEQKK